MYIIIILYEVNAVGTDINKCLCEVVRSIPRKSAMIRKVGIPEGINPVELERELNNALRDFESMLQDDGIRREIEFIAKMSRHISAQDLETKIGKAGP